MPTLVGRERHVRELHLLVDGIAAGRGSTLVLSGEAGAGKTRLAEEGATLAGQAAVQVAWATCWHTATTPLSVWTDLRAGIVADTSPTPDEPADADPEVARALLIRGLVAHFADEIADRPTLIVVDDLQWADPLSKHALERLAASARARPLGLLLTIRDDPSAPVDPHDRLLRTGRHLVVPALTEAELAELASDVTGHRLSAGALTRLHERTAGNVLFARELLGDPSLDPAAPDLDRQAPRSATMTIFAERLAGLSQAGQQVLRTASVIGRRFRLDILAEAVEADTDPLDALGEAEAAGLLREAGMGEFEFSHPLVAEACYQAGGLARRVRLHRDVAEAMERMRARGLAIAAVEIAHHFAHAAAAGAAEKAAEYAALAGQEDMEHLAYEDAARDFGLALRARDLCPADDRGRAELLLALGDAHAAAGDRPDARAAYEDAAEVARRRGWSDLLARAALGVGSGPGGFEVPPFDEQQIALLEEAARTASGRLRAEVLARLSVALALDPRSLPRRQALSQEAIEIGRTADDPVVLGYALASWCDVIPGPGDVQERLDASTEILDCAAAASDLRLELLGRRLHLVALLELGRFVDVDTEIAAYAAAAERVGQPVYSWYVPLWQAMRAVMDGRFEVADRLRREAETIGAAAHSDNAMMLTASQRAMWRCEMRDSSTSVDFFTELMEQFPDYAVMARPALAYALAAAGDGRAVDVVARLDPAAYTVATLGSEFLTTTIMAAHAAWMVGHDTGAAPLYEALLPYRGCVAIDGIGCYVVGSVERTLGVLAAQLGDRSAAADHFTAALDAHRRMQSPVLVAGTLRDAGICLADPDRQREAAEAFAALGYPGAAGPASADAAGTDATDREVARPVFRRAGDAWNVGWNGSTGHVRHTKGMADLARLLAQPGTEIHVLDLVDVGPTVDSPALGEALDDTARRQYRSRLAEIETELEDADAAGDATRSERLHLEHDALLGELSAAYGLGGRARRSGDSSERARSAVTQRIRNAIDRVDKVDADLGRHLRRAVRTGTYCAYEPDPSDQPVTWDL